MMLKEKTSEQQREVFNTHQILWVSNKERKEYMDKQYILSSLEGRDISNCGVKLIDASSVFHPNQ